MSIERWLRERVPGAPEALLTTMIEALPDQSLPLPDALAAGAASLYDAVLRGGGGREDALPLLAADALLTHAFEAQSELDPEGVAKLAEEWSARGRLAEVVR